MVAVARKPYWLILPFILACLWVRIAYPGYVPFIADEPLFQMILDDHLRAGTFPLVTMRGSSIPLAYGAGALWIYALVRAFTSSLTIMAFINGVLYSLGLLSIAWVLKERVGKTVLWLVVWMAVASPDLFFFSRLIWDNTFFVPLAGLLLLLLDHIDRRNPESISAWVGLGLVAGYMLNIHLMCGPVLLAAGVTALILLRRSRLPVGRQVFLAGIAFFVFAAFVTPYLYEAVHLYYAEGVAEKTAGRTAWGDGRNLWWLVQRSFLFLSYWKAHDLFGPGAAFGDFRAYSGAVLGAVFGKDVLGWIPKLLALGFILALPFRLWRGSRLNALEWMLLLSFPLVILVFNFLNIPTEAHYFHASWWLGFLALAFALDRLHGYWRPIFMGIVALSALINTAFIVEAAWFIRDSEGMRSYTYGTALHELQDKIEEVCRTEPSSSVKIYLDGVFLLIHPVHYFNRHLEACQGKTLALVQERAEANWVLRYRLPAPSTALTWERVVGGESK